MGSDEENDTKSPVRPSPDERARLHPGVGLAHNARQNWHIQGV